MSYYDALPPFRSLVLVLGILAIMHQKASCYTVSTSVELLILDRVFVKLRCKHICGIFLFSAGCL